MKVTLRAMVPVYVDVDLETREVSKVAVFDTGIGELESVDFGTEEWTADQISEAMVIADEASWPAWVFE